MTTPSIARTGTGAVNRLVAFAHVADVEATLAFYALLGFTPGDQRKCVQGRVFWSFAGSQSAEIMFARASGPVDAHQQAVLFYMYTPDLKALRAHLLANGVRDAGAYSGAKTPTDGTREAFAIEPRDYMPAGEMRLIDPDGYVILVGQPD